MPGYHIQKIEKGILGEYSKIIEEFEEFSDAIEQDCSVMAILELSDLIGSAKHYYYKHNKEQLWNCLIAHLFSKNNNVLPVDFKDLRENFSHTSNVHYDYHWDKMCYFISEIDQFVRSYNLTIRDLVRMSSITERAFTSGQRH